MVVSQKFQARRSKKNFNTEFGVPFSVIGVNDPGRDPFRWLALIIKAIGLIILPLSYPKFLILELGVEFPGDMDVLLKIVHPNIGIITGIGLSHYEFFKDQHSIITEKGRLAEVLNADELLLVNADNELALAMKAKTRARVISYGQSPQADVTVAQTREQLEENKYRTELTIKQGGQEISVKFPAIGKPHVQAIICAAAVGLALKIEKDLIQRGVASYKPIPGRLNIFSGLMGSTIIDDSYNAAPDSVREALVVLKRLSANNKIAVLGDMLELGEISDEEHRKIGALLPSYKINKLIVIGEGGKIIGQAAVAAGMAAENVAFFDSSDAAKNFVRGLVQPKALILVKGSQSKRLEKITKEIMAEPMRTPELLPRQYGKWLKT